MNYHYFKVGIGILKIDLQYTGRLNLMNIDLTAFRTLLCVFMGKK